MPLYTTRQLFDALPANRPCAVGAFNVHNMEYTQAVISAAEEENAPVILMIGEPMIPFAGLEMLVTICRHAAESTDVPVAIALDHGKNPAYIDRFIELGLSIMVDGSHLPFEENVRLTREVTERAHARGLSVEGELGSIGGSEDGEEEALERMTNPDAAAEFVDRTGVDILAVSIGNVHGLYDGVYRLDIERLIAIREKTDAYLVMHGGSDLPVELSQRAINEGVRKFNIGTDMKYAFSRSLLATLEQEPIPFQPPHVLGPARDAVRKVVQSKIQLFGSSGMAEVYRSRVMSE